MQISMPGEARAGEWLPLAAERRSGPWKRVRRHEAPAGLVPFGAPPAEYEKEVAASLHWISEPAGAQFDVPLTQTNERKVRFDKPGTYRVWARNAYPTEAQSNVVTVTVK